MCTQSIKTVYLPLAQQNIDAAIDQDLNVATPVTSHPVRPGIRRTYLAVTLLGFLTAVAAFVWAISRWYFAYHNYGPAVVGRWTAPALILASVLTIVGVIGLLLYLSSRSYFVITNEAGVQIKKLYKKASIPWEDIDFVRSSSIHYGAAKLEWGKRSTLWLHTSSGGTFCFTNNLMDFNNLAETIKANLYPRYLEQYRQNLNQGQSIDFGPIQLTPRGIVIGRKKCDWSMIKDVSLARGRLTITTKDEQRKKVYSLPVRKIPNSDLCAHLIQNIEY